MWTGGDSGKTWRRRTARNPTALRASDGGAQNMTSHCMPGPGPSATLGIVSKILYSLWRNTATDPTLEMRGPRLLPTPVCAYHTSGTAETSRLQAGTPRAGLQPIYSCSKSALEMVTVPFIEV